jgi:hypothetical protein
VKVDIVVFSTFGHDLGALQKWTLNQPDHISDAITDFPKMGIVVSKMLLETPVSDVFAVEQSFPYIGMEGC